jgi:hypothetical protein
MAAELLKAIESSGSSSSGVRNALAGGRFDGRRVVSSWRPPAAASPSAADSLEVADVAPQRSPRYLLFGAIALGLALIAACALLLRIALLPPHRASPEAVTPVTTAEVATSAATVTEAPPTTAIELGSALPTPSGSEHHALQIHPHPHPTTSAKPAASASAPAGTTRYGILE